jgi:DUF1680 family protein
MATPGNGLAAVMYTANEVSAKVGNGVPVKITETTNYPFDEGVSFKMSAPKSVRFSLYLRIPGWCENPQIKVNGTIMKVDAQMKGWIVIDRTWKNGDDVKLELPDSVAAPIKKGAVAGRAVISVSGRLVASENLLYASDVPRNSMEAALQKLIDLWTLAL